MRELSGDLIEPATPQRDRDRNEANNFCVKASDQFTPLSVKKKKNLLNFRTKVDFPQNIKREFCWER